MTSLSSIWFTWLASYLRLYPLCTRFFPVRFAKVRYVLQLQGNCFWRYRFRCELSPGLLVAHLFENKNPDFENILQFWVAIFQFLFGFLLIPLNTFQFLGPSYVSWSQVRIIVSHADLFYLLFSSSCLLHCGMECCAWQATTPSLRDVALTRVCSVITVLVPGCLSSFTSFSYEQIFLMSGYPKNNMCSWQNCGFNIFIILVLKHGGAVSEFERENIMKTFVSFFFLLKALLYIILTLRLPIINMAFSWRIVQDPPDPLQMCAIRLFASFWDLCIWSGTRSLVWGSLSSAWCAIEWGVSPPLTPRSRYGGTVPMQSKRHVIKLVFLSLSLSLHQETAASITLSGNMEPVSRRAPHKLARAPLSIRTSFYTRIGVVSSPRVRDRTAGQGQGQGGSTNSKAPISTL